MLKHRVIPVLLLSEDGLVKTRRFKDPRYVGDPINAIRIFNEKEVDELVVLDIQATRLRKEPNYSLIEEFASECFMPLAYGGGIQTIEHAKAIFSLGIEKIVIQSAAYSNLNFIAELAARYGSQSVVVSVDVKRDFFRKPMVWSSRRRKPIKGNWLEIIRSFGEAGAGEIYLNSVDHDGLQCGYDLELIKKASMLLDIPMVALGGASSLNDFRAAIDSGASAVAAGSMFVFQGPHRAVLISYPSYESLMATLES